jgi:hypothetical protein
MFHTGFACRLPSVSKPVQRFVSYRHESDAPRTFALQYSRKHSFFYRTPFQDLTLAVTLVSLPSQKFAGRDIAVSDGAELETTKIGWPIAAQYSCQVAVRVTVRRGRIFAALSAAVPLLGSRLMHQAITIWRRGYIIEHFSVVIYGGRLKSPWTHLITPSRNFMEVR